MGNLVGALILLAAGVKMAILPSLSSKNDAPAAVISKNALSMMKTVPLKNSK